MVEIRGSATKRRPSSSSESVGSSASVVETGEEVVGPSIRPTTNNKGKEPILMKKVKLVEPLENAPPSPPFVVAPPRSLSPQPWTPSPTPPSVTYSSSGSKSSSDNKDDDKEETNGYFVTSYNMLYPHGCDLCADRFKEAAELKIHRKTHRQPPGRPLIIDVVSTTAMRMKNIAKQKQPIVPPPPLPTVPFLTSLPPRPIVQPPSLFKPLFASSSSSPPPQSTPFMVASPQSQPQGPPPRSTPFVFTTPQAPPQRSASFMVASPQAQAPPSWSTPFMVASKQATPPRPSPFMVALTQGQAPPPPLSTTLTLAPPSASTQQGMSVGMEIGRPSGVSLELGLGVGSSIERVPRWPTQAGPSQGHGQWSAFMKALKSKANGVGSNGPPKSLSDDDLKLKV